MGGEYQSRDTDDHNDSEKQTDEVSGDLNNRPFNKDSAGDTPTRQQLRLELVRQHDSRGNAAYRSRTRAYAEYNRAKTPNSQRPSAVKPTPYPIPGLWAAASIPNETTRTSGG